MPLPTNTLPIVDVSDNPTGCCPRIQPAPWHEQQLHFENKPFERASTIGLFHMPLNMGAVFSRTWDAIKEAHADDGGFLVLSHDDSPWHAEHLFAVSRPVAGAEMAYLSGDFVTRAFDGPYSRVRVWADEMAEYVKQLGRQLETLYFFYTTCPKCARYYGHNYVVGVAKVR